MVLISVYVVGIQLLQVHLRAALDNLRGLRLLFSAGYHLFVFFFMWNDFILLDLLKFEG